MGVYVTLKISPEIIWLIIYMIIQFYSKSYFVRNTLMTLSNAQYHTVIIKNNSVSGLPKGQILEFSSK